MEKPQIIRSGIEDLCDYFRRRLTPNIAEMYFNAFNPHNTIVIQDTVKELISQGEHFPKIKEVQIVLQRLSGDNAPITYDKIEDFRFPMKYLWEAFDILRDFGKEKFKEYCEKVNMPENDRKRVIGKYEMAYNVKTIVNGIGKDVNKELESETKQRTDTLKNQAQKLRNQENNNTPAFMLSHESDEIPF